MSAFSKLLGGATLGLILAAGLASPAFAQKLDSKNGPATTAPPAVSNAEVDFGDDTSEWANDGECDDPRFAGEGSATELLDADVLKDATDCKAAYDAGTVTFTAATTPDVAPAPSIDFGDDTSEWANDGECDDPRFTGTGSATELLDADIGKDAADCKAAYDAGTVSFVGGDAPIDPPAVAEVTFGDDTSEWAKDGECDDPRFTGTGSATETLEADILKDATDCQAAYDAGTVTFVGGDAPPVEIAYGDDTSEWANDGECDDPRFAGTGVAAELADIDIAHDATDCRAAVTAGTATFNGDSAPTPNPVAAFDFGSDFSKWANDGECDDLRFYGTGVDKKLLLEDLNGDATDCKALEADGAVSIRKVYTPEYAAAAPYSSDHVEFGDNTSSYADDSYCDDPRFEGPGAAATLLDSDELHDAVDCKAAYEAGTVLLATEANGQ